MPLLLTNPNDINRGVACLKTILALFIFPGAKGRGSWAQVQAWVNQMEQAHGLDVTARFETFPERKRTVVTLTFDQVEAKPNA